MAAAWEIIAQRDSCEEPVPHLLSQSVRPRRRPGLPSVPGRAGSLLLFRCADANSAARTSSGPKVLETTVIRRVSLSLYGETPRLRRRLMMHLGATFSSAPGGLTSMQHSPAGDTFQSAHDVIQKSLHLTRLCTNQECHKPATTASLPLQQGPPRQAPINTHFLTSVMFLTIYESSTNQRLFQLGLAGRLLHKCLPDASESESSLLGSWP